MTPPKKNARRVIAWREWIQLPELCHHPIKAKIDTGAQTSALHAFDLDIEDVDGLATATFVLHPHQRSAHDAQRVSHPIHAFRRIRSSNGKSEVRPVIVTPIGLNGDTWPIEITLTPRDAMGFRMLLGRAGVRRQVLVEPGRSYLGSSTRRDERRSNDEPRSALAVAQGLQRPAATSGVIIGHTQRPLVNRGDAVVHIGEIDRVHPQPAPPKG